MFTEPYNQDTPYITWKHHPIQERLLNGPEPLRLSPGFLLPESWKRVRSTSRMLSSLRLTFGPAKRRRMKQDHNTAMTTYMPPTKAVTGDCINQRLSPWLTWARRTIIHVSCSHRLRERYERHSIEKQKKTDHGVRKTEDDRRLHHEKYRQHITRNSKPSAQIVQPSWMMAIQELPSPAKHEYHRYDCWGSARFS
jgi:hypothetical protein